MSGKDPNSELEKFRQQWKKELHQKARPHDTSDTSHPGTSRPATDGTQTPTHQLKHFSDYSLPPVNAELAQKPLNDDDSYDGFEINTFKPQTGAAASEAPSEYYPFKILTMFLNEAPKRLESKQTKAALTSPPKTFAKRKYFQETRDHNGQRSKEEDDVTKKNQQEKKLEPEEKKPMLDLFIADLDDINEIPFFDTSLPREVAIKIFHHLDMNSLCSCSQVSRSWRSLADDELLWFEIYLSLGLGAVDGDVHVSHDSNWKIKVRRLVEEKRLLNSNWRLRTGKPYQLNYAQGGVLCAVHSHGSTIVAGYTSCNVRSWDTRTGDVCTFNASNTALVLDENIEDDILCRMQNSVQQIETSEKFTAASFAHGFVDVWSCEAGTEPIYTLPFNSRNVSSLALCDVGGRRNQINHSCVVAAAQGTRVLTSHVSEQEGQVVADFDVPGKVSQVCWLTDFSSHESANLLITCPNTVTIRKVDLSTGSATSRQQDLGLMTEVHNVFWAPITAVSLRAGSSDVAVGFNVYAGAAAQIKVNIYDLTSQLLTATLTGHTWVISTIHLPESLPKQLVTGSGDRKIRLYDLRVATFPMLSLAGHSAKVTCVEMDDWKVVSADEAGFVCVWDQRMARKLWDVHNRHPVEYCHGEERLLIIGNVPYQKFLETDEFDKVSALRYRGTVQVYDFLANQQREDIPDICLSGYNEPEAYNYNLGLAVPYDQVP
ncbi:F-box/WD repeat-containing protein 8 [Plakobranchus ocellatus]|uniref:F-box/WD repeat-containing protein 8 n=1 Tax=Plakobranchus ocellatus TaxID=259542 RepID=A0AAV4BLN4_9GAST|nr:F-box/WD repeat-containing protein 8 [Plakobranchus ocellatus]